MRESARLPAHYLQPAPVRGQLEPYSNRSPKGWRYVQCTDTPDEFKVLVPPRTAALYEMLLKAEMDELAKQPQLSWERILEIRHLKDRMIRKCQRVSSVIPSRRSASGSGFSPQTAVVPADFRLREMEKWLKNTQLVPRVSNALTRKLSFESANPRNSYCCVRCAKSGKPNVHHTSKGVEAIEHQHHPERPAPRPSGLARQMTPSPRPQTPKSRDPSPPPTPRRVSTGSVQDRRPSFASGQPPNVTFISERRLSQSNMRAESTSYSRTMLPDARASRDSLNQSESDGASADEGPRQMLPRRPSHNSKSPLRRLSSSYLPRPSSPLAADTVTNSPPPLPHPFRLSQVLDGPLTDEPATFQQESSDDMRDSQTPSPNPSGDPSDHKLRRRRSCIKRTSSMGDPKSVSWAPNDQVADEISKLARAADELGKSGDQDEQIRSSYIGHLTGLDALYSSVAQSLDRVRAETEHLEKLQEAIREQSAKIKLSCAKLEQKHSVQQLKVDAPLGDSGNVMP